MEIIEDRGGMADEVMKPASTEDISGTTENPITENDVSIWKDSVVENGVAGNESVSTPSKESDATTACTNIETTRDPTTSVSTNKTDLNKSSEKITELPNGHSELVSLPKNNSDHADQPVLDQLGEDFEDSNYSQAELSSQMDQSPNAENTVSGSDICEDKQDGMSIVENETAEMTAKDCIMDIGNSDDGHTCTSDGPILDLENNMVVDCEKVEELIKNLQYLPMSMKIFHKMRETFGSEECEYCGRLFYNRTDYESHVRTHTGMYKGMNMTRPNISIITSFVSW